MDTHTQDCVWILILQGIEERMTQICMRVNCIHAGYGYEYGSIWRYKLRLESVTDLYTLIGRSECNHRTLYETVTLEYIQYTQWDTCAWGRYCRDKLWNVCRSFYNSKHTHEGDELWVENAKSGYANNVTRTARRIIRWHVEYWHDWTLVEREWRRTFQTETQSNLEENKTWK